MNIKWTDLFRNKSKNFYKPVKLYSSFFVAFVMLFCHNNTVLPSIEPLGVSLNAQKIETKWERDYFDKIQMLHKENDANNLYSLYDIDLDGIPEFFIGSKELEVFTFQNEMVTYIGKVINEPYHIPGEKGVYTYGGFGTGVGGSQYYTLQNGFLQEEEGTVDLSYASFQDILKCYFNQQEVDEEAYQTLVQTYFNNENKITLYRVNEILE